jgi:hypothetical protein
VTFEIRSEGVDVEEVMRLVRRRIEEKKRGLYTDEEIREIAEHRLEPVIDAHEFRSGLLAELLSRPGGWNYAFAADTIYRSSRGALGRVLETVRRWLQPVQKLFWNPNPMIAALSRQSDLNTTCIHLLHNLAEEVTRLNLQVQNLTNRVLQLQGRLELQARREKTLESMLAERAPAAAGGTGGGEGGG